MNLVPCPKCNKSYEDIGAFINHMDRCHGWETSESLIWWGDNYKETEFAEKEEHS